ncbi:putative holin-like toxin [Lacticaseibacillus paracasei]|nr:putative holin-like toxin [Lacticaseibacillus paracasei]MCU6431620.1 putative holin-like toxin [Lacticaseibacillus paracasei]
MSVADAITIMLAFGSFVLLLVGTVVILVRAILDNQTD